MTKPIIIGTRGSDLALWQANKVKDLLAKKGHESELKIIQSTGDKDRKAKLHEMGLVGVFTKELDDALLLEEIDVAVHSLKDVPTAPPKGIVQCAVLERANPFDVLISSSKFKSQKKFNLASGSLRRRAFWQNKYPEHTLENLRGNVPKRLKKVESKSIDGVILAKAGLDRLGLSPKNIEILDWMTPAPAQGIVGIFCLNKNRKLKVSLAEINDKNTEICAHVERDLLKGLEGGCTAPIGAYAQIVKRSVEVKASLLSNDGKTLVNHINKKGLTSYEKLGEETAKTMLLNGGEELMKTLKEAELNKLDLAETKKPAEKKIIKVKDKKETSLKPLSIKRTTVTLKEKPLENLEEDRIDAEKEDKKIELKPLTIIRTAAPVEEEPDEKAVEVEEVKVVEKKEQQLTVEPVKGDTTPEYNKPRVLCLKKLTPPRIKAGAKLGLQLSGIEVIETQPEFDSYEIKQWLNSKNNWVFSSLNAVSAITSVLKNTASIHKHIFCVGSRVANYFEGKVKGIHQVNSVSGLAEEARISGETDYVWFHGNKSDLALAEEFELLEMNLKPFSVYRTELSESRIENLENYDVFAFFSPSGVESFNAHNYIPEKAIVAAIGKTTAEYIAKVYDNQANTQLENIIVPEQYEYEHLLTAIQAHQKENGTN